MSHQPNQPDQLVQAPHIPLTNYYADEGQRRGWVQDIFNSTAVDYDRIERLVGLGSGIWYRGAALQRAGLQPGMRVLDIGVGTGLVACQAAAIVGRPALVTGIDPSPGMLEHAGVPEGVQLVRGVVERLPFADASFAFLTMGYALRHIADLSLAFVECLRVLRPGGCYCILEITCPQNKLHAWMLKAYMRGVVRWIAGLTARSPRTPALWRYYWDTIAACVPPTQVMRTLEATGFCQVERHVELGMFSEYRAHKPAA